ncbi:hypothetical protein [Limnobacter litoralis]|uniref:Uncharacterized protein n=1 Tax=Limnobacter litoralis TaxID=481366 RepID=A0ABQ5YR13_9BURK|nr:hypothetical protein [Limnobacter litoralis]GLR25800.1 hypothetical protein GCM10007875_08880 [Limnobacter litoralis]
MTEYIEPSFGVFRVELLPQPSSGLRLLLQLDYYQSNCLRMWLDMRWQSSSLRNTTLLLQKPGQLVIHKTIPESASGKPAELLKQWSTEVTRQFNLFINKRR